MKKEFRFITEIGFSNLTANEKARICNGAGGANDWRSVFIPSSLWGLDCIQIFDIHDHAYHVGRTQDDKDRADIVMLVNLVRLITAYGGWFESIRRYRAMTYFNAVSEHGADAFFTRAKRNRSERPK